MAVQKELGKITKLVIGDGGYDEAMFGITYYLTGTSDFHGTWSHRTENAEWTLEDQYSHFLEAFLHLKKTMKEAKVKDAYQLVGKPIEITYIDGVFKSWRLLTEVM